MKLKNITLPVSASGIVAIKNIALPVNTSGVVTICRCQSKTEVEKMIESTIESLRYFTERKIFVSTETEFIEKLKAESREVDND
jgi:hypothetical protein